eukprot:412907_1
MTEIVLRLKSIGCNAGFKLYSKGEWATEIYVMRLGTAKMYYLDDSDKDNKPIKKTCVIHRGAFIGLDSIIGTKRKSTLKCKTWCEFYVLKRDDFKKVIFAATTQEHATKIWEGIKEKIRNDPYKH